MFIISWAAAAQPEGVGWPVGPLRRVPAGRGGRATAAAGGLNSKSYPHPRLQDFPR